MQGTLRPPILDDTVEFLFSPVDRAGGAISIAVQRGRTDCEGRVHDTDTRRRGPVTRCARSPPRLTQGGRVVRQVREGEPGLEAGRGEQRVRLQHPRLPPQVPRPGEERPPALDVRRLQGREKRVHPVGGRRRGPGEGGAGAGGGARGRGRRAGLQGEGALPALLLLRRLRLLLLLLLLPSALRRQAGRHTGAPERKQLAAGKPWLLLLLLPLLVCWPCPFPPCQLPATARLPLAPAPCLQGPPPRRTSRHRCPKRSGGSPGQTIACCRLHWPGETPPWRPAPPPPGRHRAVQQVCSRPAPWLMGALIKREHSLKICHAIVPVGASGKKTASAARWRRLGGK